MLQLQDVLRKVQRDQGFQEATPKAVHHRTSGESGEDAAGGRDREEDAEAFCMGLQLDSHLRHKHVAKVRTGSLAQAHLWDRSGHLKHFAESMYAITEPKATHEVEDNKDRREFRGLSGPTALQKDSPSETEAAGDSKTSYLLKPMSCPLHLSLFFDDAVCLKQLAGPLHDDGHILCHVSQATAEIATFVSTCLEFHKAAGFRKNEVSIHLSTRTRVMLRVPTSRREELGCYALQGLLRDALERLGFNFTVAAGDGAFYGPKIDFLTPDSYGRLWQTGTLQVDLFSPSIFGLGPDQPASWDRGLCLLHRAVCGSLERFLGLVVEHSEGHLPFWLAPTQVAVLTVGPQQADSAECLAKRLRKSTIRVSVDTRLIPLSRKLKCGQQTNGIKQ
ncbi:hypothetical protein Emag_000816 [Eimeria magna]